MPRDYASQALTAVRRADREVSDDAWIKDYLRRAPIATLATAHENQPFVNSNLYVYDEVRHCIYMHTARLGRTRANIEQNPRVCFTIMDMGRLLPAPEALEFSVEYESVVVFGQASVVEDPAEATDALQQLLDKYAPHLSAGEDYRPPMPEELARTAVFRIDISEWSGKKKAVAADFPGAFWYNAES
jgi:nitroimidazol reductase NimA-like FMN-containing flavoprotein (pyridoxamine 5'-phosphate oxidase superfamily)